MKQIHHYNLKKSLTGSLKNETVIGCENTGRTFVLPVFVPELEKANYRKKNFDAIHISKIINKYIEVSYEKKY